MTNSAIVDIHSSISNPLLRSWQYTTGLNINDFIYPIFIKYEPDAFEDIPNMYGQKRVGFNKLPDFLDPLVKRGLKCVLLFGICKSDDKDPQGAASDSDTGPVILAIKIIRQCFPSLIVACDVCLCAYTSHGHCGILGANNLIDNTASVARLVQVSLSYAHAGCHIIAPSDCMDGRIGAIKGALTMAGYKGRVALMSYSAKFASNYYGPFRSAAQSSPNFGDRKCYQLPPGARGLAMRAVDRDVKEGADILMVKPGLPYLDIVQAVKTKHPDYALAVYHVSGEYAMLHAAAEKGIIDLKKCVLETMLSLKRAEFHLNKILRSDKDGKVTCERKDEQFFIQYYPNSSGKYAYKVFKNLELYETMYNCAQVFDVIQMYLRCMLYGIVRGKSREPSNFVMIKVEKRFFKEGSILFGGIILGYSLTSYKQDLNLISADGATLISSNFPRPSPNYEFPSNSECKAFQNYIVAYNRRTKNPDWVLEFLTPALVGDPSDKPDFRSPNNVESKDQVIFIYFR